MILMFIHLFLIQEPMLPEARLALIRITNFSHPGVTRVPAERGGICTVRVGVSTARGAWDNIRGAAPGQRGGWEPGRPCSGARPGRHGWRVRWPHVTVARLASPTAPLSLRHLPSRILFLCTDPRSPSIAFSPQFISSPPPQLHSAPTLALFGALCTQLRSLPSIVLALFFLLLPQSVLTVIAPSFAQ